MSTTKSSIIDPIGNIDGIEAVLTEYTANYDLITIEYPVTTGCQVDMSFSCTNRKSNKVCKPTNASLFMPCESCLTKMKMNSLKEYLEAVITFNGALYL